MVALSLGHHGGDVEIGLAPEVAGDEGVVDTGELADIADGRALEAVLAEQVLRGIEQCLLGRSGSGAADPVRSGRAPGAPSGWASLAALREEPFIGQHEAGAFDFRLFFHQLFDLLGRC